MKIAEATIFLRFESHAPLQLLVSSDLRWTSLRRTLPRCAACSACCFSALPIMSVGEYVCGALSPETTGNFLPHADAKAKPQPRCSSSTWVHCDQLWLEILRSARKARCFRPCRGFGPKMLFRLFLLIGLCARTLAFTARTIQSFSHLPASAVREHKRAFSNLLSRFF
jgi:hypothetical protein